MELIQVQSTKTMDSREIAELTGKNHGHVMRDIRAMLLAVSNDNPKLDGDMPQGITFNIVANSGIHYYELDKSWTYTLVAGYSVSIRKKIIDRWMELEANQAPKQLTGQALLAAAVIEAQKVIADQSKQIEEMTPKAEFYDAVTGSSDTIDIGEAAKVLAIPGLGRNNLFAKLREKGVLMHNNQPYQKHIDAGHFRQVESKYLKPDGTTCINIKTVVYQKGLEYIRKIIQ